MKKLLPILLFPCTAFAAPFVVSDPLDASATHCGVLMDSTPKQTVPVALEGTNKICKFDLVGITTGAHSIRLTAIANDPLWGQLESAPSVPFSFSRPTAPGAPAGTRTVP